MKYDVTIISYGHIIITSAFTGQRDKQRMHEAIMQVDLHALQGKAVEVAELAKEDQDKTLYRMVTGMMCK